MQSYLNSCLIGGMRTSKLSENSSNKQGLFTRLHQTLADLKSAQEIEEFLKIFLVESEHIMFAKRLNIAYLLDKKVQYAKIINLLRVSPATIAIIQQKLKTQGAQLALQKMKAEEWANEWSQKIRKFVKVG